MQGRQPNAPQESRKRSSTPMKTRWSRRATWGSQGSHTVYNPFLYGRISFQHPLGTLDSSFTSKRTLMACNAVKEP
ncbi:hypothetical protein IscW_ISCW003099 [Ixodes scapularis]|uniref:Uncharacterized protein n=1 Tax=Ixodes scapularis TaxID=6945 RepID=B7PA57_IXOSC|nr:hypothetical protein IscW_ISCW003099 [Ixodes scapularis]|eukprot:XP_002406282.1 hypothetical protein IscW_ISCW003099 [Ixodes scapularis]